MAADYERQRSSSFSDLTPRGNARTLPSVEGDLAPPPSQLRSLFSAPGSVGSSVSLALNSSRKGSALSIRDPVSGSGRASPAFSTVRAAVRQNSGSTPFRSLEAYSQRNVAAALESGADLSVRPIDDVWQAVCVRVLPLFNGEAPKGFVEDMNELVSSHVQRTIARCQTRNKPTADTASLATGLLTADVSELLSIGFLTLMSKLAPGAPSPPLTDDKFLQRLNEVWHFFWTSILPHLESIFWMLRSDERLRPTVTSGRESRTRLDVRRLGLIGFRDHLVLPRINRVSTLFRELCESRPSGQQPHDPQTPTHPTSPVDPNSYSSFPFANSNSHSFSNSDSAATSSLHPPVAAPSGISASLQAANARRRQMVSVLASLLTADERQSEMDDLLRVMRATSVPIIPATTAASTPSPQLSRGQPSESRSLSESDGPTPIDTRNLRTRARAGTMDSLDEDEAATFEVGGGSMTPQAGPSTIRGRRKGFLPRLGKNKSSSASSITTRSITAPTIDGESDSRTRGRSGSGRGEESSQSERER